MAVLWQRLYVSRFSVFFVLMLIASLTVMFFALNRDVQHVAAICLAIAICQTWYGFARRFALWLRHGKRGTMVVYRILVGSLFAAAFTLSMVYSIDSRDLISSAPWKTTVWLVFWGSLGATMWPRDLLSWAPKKETSQAPVSSQDEIAETKERPS